MSVRAKRPQRAADVPKLTNGWQGRCPHPPACPADRPRLAEVPDVLRLFRLWFRLPLTRRRGRGGRATTIANPFDEEQNAVIRWIETKDTSSPLARLYNKIAERTAASEDIEMSDFDMADPQQAAIWKTTQILLNKVIYADSYLSN